MSYVLEVSRDRHSYRRLPFAPTARAVAFEASRAMVEHGFVQAVRVRLEAVHGYGNAVHIKTFFSKRARP